MAQGPPPVPLSLGPARALAGRLLSRLEREPAALRLALCGAARRMQPLVERVDLLATAHEVGPLVEAFVSAPRVTDLVERGERHAWVRFEDGSEARLDVLADEADVPAAWIARTGPPAHVEALRERARARGLAWEGHRLLRGGSPLPLEEEADLYAALGLAYVCPERRGALLGAVAPDDPIAMRAVRGAAGLYVRGGGGRYALEEMAARAAREGYGWGIAVHEGTAAADLEAFAAHLQAWNDAPEPALRLLGAVVLPIDAAGAVHDPRPPDLAPLLLGLAVLAAPPPAAPPGGTLSTERLVRAAADVRVDLLSVRPWEAPAAGAPAPRLDAERLARALAQAGVPLWMPPPPRIPEPEPALLEAAAAHGARVLLSCEARDLVGVDDLILSVGLARRAGLTEALVLNALAPERVGAAALRRGAVRS